MQAELSGSSEDPIATVGICSGDLVHMMQAQCPAADPMSGLSCDSRQSRHTSASHASPAGLSSDLLDHPASLRVAVTAPFQQDSSAPAAQNGAGPSSEQLEAAAAVPGGDPKSLACEPGEWMETASELDSEVRGWLCVGTYQSATGRCKCTPPSAAGTMFNFKLQAVEQPATCCGHHCKKLPTMKADDVHADVQVLAEIQV